VHAFEYLRSVARTRRGDDTDVAVGLVQMVAHGALEGPDLLVAARRLIERRPDAIPLWWSAARLIMAADASRTAQEILRLWDEDLEGVPHDECGEVAGDDDPLGLPAPLTAFAASGSRFVLTAGETARLDTARLADRRVRVEVPVGRSLDDTLLSHVIGGSVGRGLVVHDGDERITIVHRGPLAPHVGALLRRSAI
jgi:hypothetical protein